MLRQNAGRREKIFGVEIGGDIAWFRRRKAAGDAALQNLAEIGRPLTAVRPIFWKLLTKAQFVSRWVPAGSVSVSLLGAYWLTLRVWGN